MSRFSSEGIFAAGMALGAFCVAVVVGIAVSGIATHYVGGDQRVCMTIAEDATRTVQACATGEELIDYLRRREGISK